MSNANESYSIKSLKEKSKTLEPVIRIGKNGLSVGTIEELIRQLRKKKLIKAKLLKSFVHNKNIDELALEVARSANAILVDRIGLVLVLAKRLSKSEKKQDIK